MRSAHDQPRRPTTRQGAGDEGTPTSDSPSPPFPCPPLSSRTPPLHTFIPWRVVKSRQSEARMSVQDDASVLASPVCVGRVFAHSARAARAASLTSTALSRRSPAVSSLCRLTSRSFHKPS